MKISKQVAEQVKAKQNKPKAEFKPRGLYHKYDVINVDEGATDLRADYFVLRLDTDTYARLAAMVYASAVRVVNPQLATDLLNKIKGYGEASCNCVRAIEEVNIDATERPAETRT